MALPDDVPAFLVESFYLAVGEFVFAVHDGLDQEVEMLGGKSRSELRNQTRAVLSPTPGEDASLVASEQRAIEPVLVLESQAYCCPVRASQSRTVLSPLEVRVPARRGRRAGRCCQD